MGSRKHSNQPDLEAEALDGNVGDDEDTEEDAAFIATASERGINLVCDSLVSNILAGILMITAGAEFGEGIEPKSEYAAWSYGFTSLYYVFFEAVFARTPGKWLTRTRVVANDGTAPSLRQIVIRTLVRLIPFEWVTFMSRAPRGLHDRWSHTCVVVTSRRRV